MLGRWKRRRAIRRIYAAAYTARRWARRNQRDWARWGMKVEL